MTLFNIPPTYLTNTSTSSSPNQHQWARKTPRLSMAHSDYWPATEMFRKPRYYPFWIYFGYSERSRSSTASSTLLLNVVLQPVSIWFISLRPHFLLSRRREIWSALNPIPSDRRPFHDRFLPDLQMDGSSSHCPSFPILFLS